MKYKKNLNEPEFNGFYSRNNFSEIRNGVYIINLDEYESIVTHWIALYVNPKNVTYFESFGAEHIPRKIRKFIGNKSLITYICRMQGHDSVRCGCFCNGFIDFMLKDKGLLEYWNLFSPNGSKKNETW